MKKCIAIILTIAIVLGLCACEGGGETNTPEGLQIGYGRVDFMPDGQVNMLDGSNQASKISTGYLDVLYATCLAITENGTTVLLYSTDAQIADMSWTAEARKLIGDATGVPQANIQIGATHTHAGPAVGSNEPLVMDWKPIYMNALVKAAQDAIADQAAATLYGQKVQTEGLAFARHYKMQDGSYAGPSYGDYSIGIVEHAAEANEEMILLKMDREGDKKDVLLMNFQAHPAFDAATDLSSDFIGTVRDTVEGQTDMHFIYFTGSAGNQNTNSKIGEENGPANRKKDAYGEALAKYAIDALPSMTPITGSGVKTTQKTVEYASNDYGKDRAAKAEEVLQKLEETKDNSVATTYAKSLGFYSVTECKSIVKNAKYPATGEMELNVCGFGGVAFVAAPYEMFSGSAFYIQENSPFDFTIISTTTNGYNNYYPTKEAFEHGCYEAINARFASGVAEFTQEKFVEMLKEVQ